MCELLLGIALVQGSSDVPVLSTTWKNLMRSAVLPVRSAIQCPQLLHQPSRPPVHHPPGAPRQACRRAVIPHQFQAIVEPHCAFLGEEVDSLIALLQDSGASNSDVERSCKTVGFWIQYLHAFGAAFLPTLAPSGGPVAAVLARAKQGLSRAVRLLTGTELLPVLQKLVKHCWSRLPTHVRAAWLR